jgi:molecular chaperone DnaK (HSP70)
MPIRIISSNNWLGVHHETGLSSAAYAIALNAESPTLVALSGETLADGSVTVESSSNCRCFFDPANPAEALARACREAAEMARGQQLANPAPLSGMHAFLLLEKKQSQFVLKVNTAHRRITTAPGGTRHVFRYATRCFHLLPQREANEWEDTPALTCLVAVLGPLPVYPQAFAIDLGTTNTCAAYMRGTPPRPTLFCYGRSDSRRGAADPEDVPVPHIPTMLAYTAINGESRTSTIGVEAANQDHDGGMNNVVRGMKRYLGWDLGGPKEYTVTVDGEPHQLKAIDAYYDFVHTYLSDFPRQVTAKLRHVKATYPPDVRPRAKEAMSQVYKRLHIDTSPQKLFGIDEASAAALYYVYKRLRKLGFDVEQYKAHYNEKHTLLVFDLGGGTTDISVVSVRVESRLSENKQINEWFLKVLGTASLLHIGGDNFTLQIVKALKCRIALVAARFHKEKQSLRNQNFAPSTIRAMEALARDEAKFQEALAHPVGANGRPVPDLARLGQLAEDVLPTQWPRFLEPPRADLFASVMAKSTFYVLWNLAEISKPQLCDTEELKLDATDFTGGSDAYQSFRDLNLDAKAWGSISLRQDCDFYQRIRPMIERAVATCRQVAVGAPGEDRKIDSIQLVGNSCRIPLVRKIMEEHFADRPALLKRIDFDGDDAKASVALGACLAAHINDFGHGTDMGIFFDNRGEELGWEIGVMDAFGHKFTPYFTPTSRLGSTKEIDESEVHELQIFRRRSWQADNEREVVGSFRLNEPGVVHPEVPAPPAGKMRLHLKSHETLYLVTSRHEVYALYKDVIDLKPDYDPFSGHH